MRGRERRPRARLADAFQHIEKATGPGFDALKLKRARVRWASEGDGRLRVNRTDVSGSLKDAPWSPIATKFGPLRRSPGRKNAV